MKGIITSVMFVSLMTVVPAVQASEVSVETASRFSQTKETAFAFVGNATSWARTGVPAFVKSIPGLIKEGLSFVPEFAKENPGKMIAAAAAALIVARAAYVIGFNYLHFNYLNSDAIILLSNPPQVIFGDKKRFIPRSWIEKWRLNKTSDYWHSSEIVEIRNKKTL